MKKFLCSILILALSLAVSGCEYYEGKDKVCAISYDHEIFNGVTNNETYNGIKSHFGDVLVAYFENTNPEEFEDNLKTILNENFDFIWCLEAGGAETVLKHGKERNDIKFCLLDTKLDKVPPNFITLSYREHEGGFLAGYLAAKYSDSKQIGFLGMEGEKISEKYKNGFIAGANYAGRIYEFEPIISTKYVSDSFNRSLAKSAALSLYNESNCDVIFHALQSGGVGAIEAAVEVNKYIIGSSVEQSGYGPNNVLTSIIKNSKVASSTLLTLYNEDELEFGKNYEYGVDTRTITLSKTYTVIEKPLYDEVSKIRGLISSKEIMVPATDEELSAYLQNLEVMKAKY